MSEYRYVYASKGGTFRVMVGATYIGNFQTKRKAEDALSEHLCKHRRDLPRKAGAAKGAPRGKLQNIYKTSKGYFEVRVSGAYKGSYSTSTAAAAALREDGPVAKREKRTRESRADALARFRLLNQIFKDWVSKDKPSRCDITTTP